jgi:lysophospholipid acyltransferase (LPLAT)-like uncharacterized protein
VTSEPTTERRASGPGVAKRFWRKVRKPLAQSRFAKATLASFLANVVRFVYWTNPARRGSADSQTLNSKYAPAIVALWHGQHILAPSACPPKPPMVAMVSRSADAELNALVVEKLGLETVRGSGGRAGINHFDKGGAKALITLKRALESGKNVAMIADIPHGTPREAGLGVILLAKYSGRPIMPLAVATSRRKVLEKTWDKTVINLPFGRRSVVVGDPLYVPADATAEELEVKRQELTDALNEATARAYRMVDERR